MTISDSKITLNNPHHAKKDRHSIRNPKSKIQNQKTWLSIDFDRIDYREAWELQGNLIMARKERILQNDIVLFLEHPPVFTLGRRGGRECMLVSEEFLEKAGVQVIQVERGWEHYLSRTGPAGGISYRGFTNCRNKSRRFRWRSRRGDVAHRRKLGHCRRAQSG